MYLRISLGVALALAALVSHVSGSKHTNFQARNLKTINSLYDLTVYPIPTGLFNLNATGRVSPIGTFSGLEDSIEYFFALAPIPSEGNNYGVITNAKIIDFSSGCPEVASSVVYFEIRVVNPGAANDGTYISSLKQIAFWRFDDKGAVMYYDAWIANHGAWIASIIPVDYTNPTVQSAVTAKLCSTIEQLCVGANLQYSDVANCTRTLSSRPFGSWDEVWGDNVVCREVHTILAAIRPDVHCPHVGPAGGGKCVDTPYVEAYFDDEALFGSPSGKTFQCPGTSEYST